MGTSDCSDASVRLLALGLCVGQSLGEEALLLEGGLCAKSWQEESWMGPAKGAGRDFALNCLLIPSC